MSRTVSVDDLVERINNEGYELACGDAFFESIGDPHQTVCVVYMIQSLIDNGGVIMSTACGGEVPYATILDSFERIGCAKHAELLRECLRRLGCAPAMTLDEVVNHIEKLDWDESVTANEPLTAQWYELPDVWACLSRWVLEMTS